MYSRTVSGLVVVDADKVSIEDTLVVQGTATFNGDAVFAGTTTLSSLDVSGSSDFGAIQVRNATGNSFVVDSTTDATGVGTGAISCAGGISAAKVIYAGTGFVTAGGLSTTGIATIGGFDLRLGTADQASRGDSGNSRALVKNTGPTLVINCDNDFSSGVQVQSKLSNTDSSESTSAFTGSFTTPGGIGAAKNINAGGNIGCVNLVTTGTGVIGSTTESTSSITGALTTPGGLGVVKNINAGGNISGTNFVASGTATINSTAEAVSAVSAALVVAGGIGVGKFIRTSSGIYVGNTLFTTSTSNDVVLNANGSTIYLRPTIGSANHSVEVSTSSFIIRDSGGVAKTTITNGGDIACISVTGTGTIVTSNNTSSGSSTTGAIRSVGGISSQENINAGGYVKGQTVYVKNALLSSNGDDLFINAVNGNNVYIRKSNGSSNNQLVVTSTGLHLYDGSGVLKTNVTNGGDFALLSVTATGVLKTTSTTAATSTTTGCLQLGGGAGIAGSLWVGGSVNCGQINGSGLYVTGGVSADGTGNFGGADFRLGYSNNGSLNSGLSRALVKADIGGPKLVINYANDFTSGTEINGNAYVTGTLGSAGNLTVPQIIGGQSAGWTPTFATGTSITYTLQTASYYKLGNMVMLNARIETSSAIDLTATDLRVLGNSFVNNSGLLCTGTVVLYNYALPTSTDTINCYVEPASSIIRFIATRDNLDWITVKSPTTAATRILVFQITLFT